jgi:hypothetical protein
MGLEFDAVAADIDTNEVLPPSIILAAQQVRVAAQEWQKAVGQWREVWR